MRGVYDTERYSQSQELQPVLGPEIRHHVGNMPHDSMFTYREPICRLAAGQTARQQTKDLYLAMGNSVTHHKLVDVMSRATPKANKGIIPEALHIKRVAAIGRRYNHATDSTKNNQVERRCQH